MRSDGSGLRRLSNLLVVVIVLAVAALIADVVYTLHMKNSTGILQASADSPAGLLSVTKNNGQAKILGTGSARVRLSPGSYLVASKDNGNFAYKIVSVYAKQVTKVTINAAQTKSIVTATTPNFINFDVLVDTGLSATQLDNLEQLFETYRPTATNVSVDTDSVVQLGHGANSTDTSFTINFTGSIDTTAYKATLVYADTENITLTLVNPQTGEQIYAGNAPSSPDS